MNIKNKLTEIRRAILPSLNDPGLGDFGAIGVCLYYSFWGSIAVALAIGGLIGFLAG